MTFPPELRAATDAWRKTNPLTNPDAPRSPFDMPGYQVAEQVSQELEQLANQKAAEANDANELADRYVLLTVIFATSLFFCGISGKFQWQVIDIVMLSIGALVLLARRLRVAHLASQIILQVAQRFAPRQTRCGCSWRGIGK